MAVDGQTLMQNREVLTLDEERILADAERYMKCGHCFPSS